MSVTHLVFDLARESRSVVALTAAGPAPKPTRILRDYTLYLCAHQRVSGEPIPIDDIIKGLGISYEYRSSNL